MRYDRMARKAVMVVHKRDGKYPWVVRLKGKILSKHLKKNAAMKRARIEARKRPAYHVLVQNMAGQFAETFKPR